MEKPGDCAALKEKGIQEGQTVRIRDMVFDSKNTKILTRGLSWMTFDRSALKEAKRIVVKVGTSTITYANGKRNFEQIDRLARELADLQNQGKEMILVTSGAVAVGVAVWGCPKNQRLFPASRLLLLWGRVF